MPFCASCNGYYSALRNHCCPPLWRCWLDDEDESDGRDVHSGSGDLAAERFVEKLGDASDGDEYVIHVRLKGSTTIERHQVSVSLMLTYTSTQLEEIEEEADEETPENTATCWRCEGAERFEGHVCDGCGSVADGAGGTVPTDEDEDEDEPPLSLAAPPSYRLPTTPVEDLLGMPRCITKDGRVEVDGRPGGVRARFESLGQDHVVDINARDVEGQPCADEKALHDLVARYVEECWSVSPGKFELSPLEVDVGH